MMQESLPIAVDRETARPAPPPPNPFPPEPDPGLLHRLIAGNYFYFLSAALMLLGCYQLIHTTAVTQAIFGRTLKTLLILQGYELLVIATALLIVWRFKVLDDAFSLLLVELLLLLDPTFFSNSFFTMLKREDAMLSTQGILVNVICFGLVPLKLLILQRGLKLRLSPACWATFLFAAVFAYLIEGPLSRRARVDGLSVATYHYLMDWGPLLFAFLAPPLRKMVTVASPAPDYVSEHRRLSLGAVLLVAPLAVIIAHLIESARVHELTLYPFDFAPLALAAAVLIIRQANPGSRGGVKRLLYLCDALALLALLLSSKWLNPVLITGKPHAVGYAVDTLPAFPLTALPLILGGAGVAGMYLLFHGRFRYRPALTRLALLALGGVAAGLASVGAVRGAAAAAGLWLRHAWAVCVAALAGAAHGIGGLLQAGLGWLKSAGELMLNYFLEVVQAFLIALLLFDHARRRPRLDPETRYSLAAVAVVIGLARYGNTQAGWSMAVCGAELGLLLLAVWLTRRLGFGVLALAQTAAFVLVSLTYENVLSTAASKSAAALSAWLGEHPDLLAGVIWLALLALALRWSHSLTWFLCGLLSIWITAGWLPGDRGYWVPEIIQAFFILGVVLDHRFNPAPNQGGRGFAMFLVVVFALGRFADQPVAWSALIVAAEAIALLTAAILCRQVGYAVLAAVELAGLVTIGWNSGKIEMSPGMLVITAAMAFFAVGILITFNKERLLRRLAAPPPAPPDPNQGQIQKAIMLDELKQKAEWELNESSPACVAEPAAMPVPPPLPADTWNESQHLLATVQTLFQADPPFDLALRHELPRGLIAQLETGAGAEAGNPQTVFLIKGEPAARQWNLIPTWICYPADADHPADGED